MKKIFILTAILISFLSFAQVPQGISYQAIALNSSGNPVASSNVGIRLSVLDNSATGTALYTETQTKTTNAQGLFNLVIGQGTPTTGNFSAINWGTNSKFLKVEMDITGGTNYVLVGTTQLLSVPYALAADSLVTSPGEGITLVSPNGTPYQVTVNDSGQLSLPTSGSSSTIPTSLYLYGTFNNFNAITSLLLGNFPNYSGCGGVCTISPLAGYKYLTSGTEIKFLSQNNSSSPIYGINSSNALVINGNSYTIPNNGFYYLEINRTSPNNTMPINIYSISPTLDGNNIGTLTPTYNPSTNIFSFMLNGVTTAIGGGGFNFTIEYPGTGMTTNSFGDNLSDGTIEHNGTPIYFPGISTTPKNYRVDLVVNFNGSGTYTITQIP